MIQRIQSIYLLLGALALVVLLLFNAVWEGRAAASLAWFAPAVLGLGGLIAATALGSIFLYKDRTRQRKVVLVILFSTLAFMIVFYGGLYLGGDLSVVTATGEEAGFFFDAGRLVALLLPVLAYVFFTLARRAIDRDIALVRSMDRLR